MKKYVSLFIVMFLLLSGCSKNTETPFDPAATADALLASDAFTDTLAEVSNQVVVALYKIDESTLADDSIAYVSSGASAEEIAVLAFTDEAAAQAALPLLQQRVDAQIAACQDYLPDELPKLDSAIIEARGNTAILVVAADADAAQTVLDGLK